MTGGSDRGVEVKQERRWSHCDAQVAGVILKTIGHTSAGFEQNVGTGTEQNPNSSTGTKQKTNNKIIIP